MNHEQINFKIHKELNFFRLIRMFKRINKDKMHLDYGHRDFYFELPIEVDITKEDEKTIEKFFRNQKNDPEKIMRFPELKKIYEKNKEQWEKYWNENVDNLEKTKDKIEKEFKKFDLSVFDKVARFFEKNPPEKADVIICMGNKVGANASVNLFHNKIFVFPRKFYQQPKEDLTKEVSKIVHEIVHLCQDWYNILIRNRDMAFLEKTANCFASKGILINEDKVRREGKSLEFYNTIKDAFEKGKTISDIRDKLEKLKDFKYYK